ncbi:hypothetical protein Q3G72_016941 [Acer saccharum]|nr:hypothetical protein Q3G72_016941 [Acer saccharum]
MASNNLAGKSIEPNTRIPFKMDSADLNSCSWSKYGGLSNESRGLRSLKVLVLSLNNLTILLTRTTAVYANLQKFRVIGLGSCNLNDFLSFLHKQDQLVELDLSSNKIAGQIPEWLLNSSTGSLKYLNLSYNHLSGFGQHFEVLPWTNLSILDLRFNELQGKIPIPPLNYLLSNNHLTGEISPQMCNLIDLSFLDLYNNNLSGVLPKCLGGTINSLIVLNLRNNKFHGRVPQFFSDNLGMLDLSHNLLQGRIPRSLANCTRLQFLNLGNNQISDVFPSWLGTIPQLEVLILHSNKLHGVIREPKTDFEFSKLRIIDLSHNKFTGVIQSKYF